MGLTSTTALTGAVHHGNWSDSHFRVFLYFVKLLVVDATWDASVCQVDIYPTHVSSETCAARAVLLLI